MKVIRIGLLGAALYLSACDYRTSGTKPTSPAPPQEPPSSPSQGFLGLEDDQSAKIGDTSPESALAGITSISKVQVASVAEYERARSERRIKAEETRDGYVYYAIEISRHVPFPNGTSASVTVTERFKAKLPDDR